MVSSLYVAGPKVEPHVLFVVAVTMVISQATVDCSLHGESEPLPQVKQFK